MYAHANTCQVSINYNYGQDGGAARRCCDSLRFSNVFCVLQCRPGGLPADEISFQDIKLPPNPEPYILNPKTYIGHDTSSKPGK